MNRSPLSKILRSGSERAEMQLVVRPRRSNWQIVALQCLLLVLFSSCKKISPDPQVPSYIHIDSTTFSTDYTSQGSSSSRITDAWIYIDQQLIGSYELPVTFPVLLSGDHSIIVRAGIMVNGIAAIRSYYPFYSFHEQTITLTPGKILSIAPSVTYLAGAGFAWKEDFEDPGFTIEKTAKSDSVLQIKKVSKDSSFEGNGAAFFYLGENDQLIECKSTEHFKLPKNATPVYLEMNFKCSGPLVVGMFSNTAFQSFQEPLIILSPTDHWKKIYLNMTDMVASHFDAIDQQIFFGAINNGAKQEFYLDNVKLLYLK